MMVTGTLDERMMRAVERLSDEELQRVLAATERCARCMTRSRRDLELARLRCLRCELERRSGGRPQS